MSESSVDDKTGKALYLGAGLLAVYLVAVPFWRLPDGEGYVQSLLLKPPPTVTHSVQSLNNPYNWLRFAGLVCGLGLGLVWGRRRSGARRHGVVEAGP